MESQAVDKVEAIYNAYHALGLPCPDAIESLSEEEMNWLAKLLHLALSNRRKQLIGESHGV